MADLLPQPDCCETPEELATYWRAYASAVECDRNQLRAQVEEVDAWLAKAADQLNATPFMQAMDLGHHITNWRLARQKHPSTVGEGK